MQNGSSMPNYNTQNRTDGLSVDRVLLPPGVYTGVCVCVCVMNSMMSPIPIWPSHRHPMEIITFKYMPALWTPKGTFVRVTRTMRSWTNSMRTCLCVAYVCVFQCAISHVCPPGLCLMWQCARVHELESYWKQIMSVSLFPSVCARVCEERCLC